MARMMEESWVLIDAMLDEMEYRGGREPMWYLDRRLDVRLSVLCAAASAA